MYTVREFVKKRVNCGVFARFVLFLSGIDKISPNRKAKLKNTKTTLSVKAIKNEFKKQKFTPKTFPKSFPILGKIQPFTAFAKHAVKSKKSQVKPEILVAGVERFERPNDGVRVRSLTAWRYPSMSAKSPRVYPQNNSAFI